MAISDAMADGNPVAGWTACIPVGVTGQQVVDVAVQYLGRNAAKRHVSASSLVAAAFTEAFPCR
jgi:hypothetical protein